MKKSKKLKHLITVAGISLSVISCGGEEMKLKHVGEKISRSQEDQVKEFLKVLDREGKIGKFDGADAGICGGTRC